MPGLQRDHRIRVGPQEQLRPLVVPSAHPARAVPRQRPASQGPSAASAGKRAPGLRRRTRDTGRRRRRSPRRPDRVLQAPRTRKPTGRSSVRSTKFRNAHPRIGHLLLAGEQAGVEHHDPRDTVRLLDREPQPDRAAPVVHDNRGVTKVQILESSGAMQSTCGRSCTSRASIGLSERPKPGRSGAMQRKPASRDGRDHLAPQERPRRLAVEEHDRRARRPESMCASRNPSTERYEGSNGKSGRPSSNSSGVLTASVTGREYIRPMDEACDLCDAGDPRHVLDSPRLDGPLVRCRNCGLVYVGTRSTTSHSPPVQTRSAQRPSQSRSRPSTSSITTSRTPSGRCASVRRGATATPAPPRRETKQPARRRRRHGHLPHRRANRLPGCGRRRARPDHERSGPRRRPERPHGHARRHRAERLRRDHDAARDRAPRLPARDRQARR